MGLKRSLGRFKHRILDGGRWLAAFAGIRARKETRVLAYVVANAEPGNPLSVLLALDAFATETEFLMNLGPDKLVMLDEVFGAHDIHNAIELGAYCGYSAVAIAMRLPEDGQLVSVEISGRLAEVARAVVAHAGLSERVDVRVGTADCVAGEAADLVLLDHAKDRYLPDLRIIEPSLSAGAVIFADNTGLFPEEMAAYLAHVRGPAYATSRAIITTMEYRPDVYDEVEVSVLA